MGAQARRRRGGGRGSRWTSRADTHRLPLIHVPSLLTWHLLLPGEAAQGWRAGQSLGLKLHLEAGLRAAGLPKVAIEVGVYDVLEFRPTVQYGFPAHCLMSNRASVDVPKSTQRKAPHAPAWKRLCRRTLLEESRLEAGKPHVAPPIICSEALLDL